MISIPKALVYAALGVSWAVATVVPQHRAEKREIGKPKIPGTLVGYRAMGKTEVDATKAAGGKLTYIGNSNGIQIGEGIYTGLAIGDWVPEGDYWICAVVLATDDFNNLDIVNIPALATNKKGQCYDLWYDSEAIEKYMQTKHDADFTNDNTLRVSAIINRNGVYQTVIGSELIEDEVFAVDCCSHSDTACTNDLQSKYGTASFNGWDIIGGKPDPAPGS